MKRTEISPCYKLELEKENLFIKYMCNMLKHNDMNIF